MYIPKKPTESDERQDRICEEARDTHRDTMMNIEPLDHNLYFFANIWVLFLAETVPKVLKCTPPSLLLRYNSSPKSGELETYKGRSQIAMFAILPLLGGVRGGIWEKEKLPIYWRAFCALASAWVCISFRVLMISVPESGMTTVDLLMRASLLFTRASMSFAFCSWSAV